MADTYIFGKPVGFSSLKELDKLLNEGEQSGEPIEMTPAEWLGLQEDIEADRSVPSKAS